MVRKSRDSGYRPEIDGLRGIAILSVLLNHTDSRLLSGGYVGVDVFFVISGFLITTIVRRDLDAGRFSFWHFYARRAKRLIPAATVMAIATLVLGYLFLLPYDFWNFGRSLVAYGAMLSNVFFWRQPNDYWVSQSSHWPLLHTWSLSVEEQFYLVYPLILWGLLGLPPRRQLQAISALLAASFVVGLYETGAYPRAAYFLLPSRAWELLAGAACSLFGPAPQSRGTCGLLGLVAAGLVGLPMFLFTDATQFPGWIAALPVTGTALLLWITRDTSSIWKMALGWKPLVAIGQVSYSLYLFHWPMIVFAKYLWAGSPESPSLAPSYFAAVASFPIAWLSYRYVETPGRSSRISDKPTVAMAFACGLLLLLVGCAIRYCEGLPGRMAPTVVQYARGSSDQNPRRQETQLDNSKIKAGESARLGKDGPLDFVLWGDSHADALVPVFEHLAKQNDVSGTAFTRIATAPLIDIAVRGRSFDPEFAGVVLDRLRKDRIPYVILAARWGGYLEGIRKNSHPLETRSQSMALLRRSLSETITQLRDSGAKKIWIVRQVPSQPCDVPRGLALKAWLGRYLPLPTLRSVTPDEYAAEMEDLDTLFASFVAEDVGVIDLATAVFANKDGLLTEQGEPMYYDDDHLSVCGALSLDLAIQPIFEQIKKAKRPAGAP
jgi:peptidoglycan/LPS O-acetylase OafA/YrhL